jgi:dynein heavy chain
MILYELFFLSEKILPEYQKAHERNVYKTVAIVANTKKLIQNINMTSLQELRSLQKPSTTVEDVLASVIIICKINKTYWFNLF